MSGTRPTVERPDVETQWTTDRGSSGLVPDGQTTCRVGQSAPYAIAVLCTAAATGGDTTIVAAGGHILFAFYLLAVTASAIYRNGRAAVLAIALSAVSISYFFLVPFHAFSITAEAAYVLPCSFSLAAP